MIFRKTLLAGLVFSMIAGAAVPSWAEGIGKKKQQENNTIHPPNAAQNALIDKSIAREREVIKVLRERAPLVETYIQNMRPDTDLGQVPESDQHFLGRVDFGKVIGDDTYQNGPKAGTKESKMGAFKHSLAYITGIGNALHLQFRESGFVRMILIDSTQYDRQHYQFSFVRNEFLGTTPTAVFDVTPLSGHGLLKGTSAGHFFGRIWIETRGGNIVRFNGDLSGTEKTIAEYYHFDSWRTNIQPDLWLPTSFYVEESDPKSQTSTLRFKAINYVWGYSLKLPTQEASSTSMDVVGATDVSNDATDVSPLGAQRAWVQQAEDNIIDRLFQAGLLDSPSDFDKILATIANNILAYNNIAVSRPIRVRTLLTEPLESLAVGNTIILSKGLIDTTAVPSSDGSQQLGNLNAVIAFQLAHIIRGHRLDTKYAFNDRLPVPRQLRHSSAFPCTTPMPTIWKPPRRPSLCWAPRSSPTASNTSAFIFSSSSSGSKRLHALTEPMIGDGLTRSDTDSTFWLQGLVGKGEKLDMANLKQEGAMPLNFYLRFDPWTDQVIQTHPAF